MSAFLQWKQSANAHHNSVQICRISPRLQPKGQVTNGKVRKNQPHLNLPGNVPDVARLRTQARPMQGKIAQHGANSAALATRRIILLRYAGMFPRLRWPKNQLMTLDSQAKAWLENQWTRIRFFGKASQTKISCDRQQ